MDYAKSVKVKQDTSRVSSQDGWKIKYVNLFYPDSIAETHRRYCRLASSDRLDFWLDGNNDINALDDQCLPCNQQAYTDSFACIDGKSCDIICQD